VYASGGRSSKLTTIAVTNPAGTPNTPELMGSIPNHLAPATPVNCAKKGCVETM
jgi:hypothetical protein